MTAQVTDIPVTKIKPGQNDRQHFDHIKLDELAASISQHGLAQPITVRPLYTCPNCEYETGQPPTACPHCGADAWLNLFYQIVAGERRFRAISEILKRDTAPCIIRHLSDEEADGIMLTENTGRADLNPIEEAAAYRARIDRRNWSIDQIATIAGVSADRVTRRLSLLDLTPDIQHLVAHGHLPLGHAEAMTKLDNNRQRIALRLYNESKGKLTLGAFRDIINQMLEEQSQDSLFDLEAFWIQQIAAQNDLPRSGKRAVTGAPLNPKLPPISIEGNNNNTGAVIDAYIADLLAAGLHTEAAAVGNLYNALVHSNYARVPLHAKLLK